MSLAHELIDYAKSFLGVPYVWGGNNRLAGMDCSGFVCEVLRSVGLLGSEDHTAQGIFDTLSALPNVRTSNRGAVFIGSVLFFKGSNEERISHVAIALNWKQMIEAGGAGSACTDKDKAAKLGAMVRVRPIKSRSDLFCVLRPDYVGIEMGALT